MIAFGVCGCDVWHEKKEVAPRKVIPWKKVRREETRTHCGWKVVALAAAEGCVR